ncbi:MAG: methyltransferase [candidate division WOR-3 bacterium]
MNSFVKLGRFFYRYRSLIAVLFFLLLLILGKPVCNTVLPHIFIICGIVIRVCAAGYIGEKSRGKEIRTEYRIVNGPYRILKHPLYIGNFFLVLGTICLFNPPNWLKLCLILAFLLEYSIIIFAEEEYMKDLPVHNIKFSVTNLKSEFSTIIVLAAIYFLYFLIIL